MNKYLAVLLLLLTATAAQATDSFNSSTNILAMDYVVSDGKGYANVVVQLNGYSVIGEGGVANGAADVFNSATKVLFLGKVIADGVQHNNVMLQLQNYSVTSATLVSAQITCPSPPCMMIIVNGIQQCVYANNRAQAC